MQPLFAILYGWILSLGIIAWAKCYPGKTGFVKGKGTLDQVLRIIIALAKIYQKNLFLGRSKAFEKVEMFASQVKLGVGSGLLEALKVMYLVTHYVLKSTGKISVFHTFSGI